MLDPESGLPHISHVTCNSMFLPHFQIHEEPTDDDFVGDFMAKTMEYSK